MIIRRVGLVLAAVLSLAAIPSALDIEPDPATGSVEPLSVVLAVLSCAIAAVTVALLVPAWNNVRWAALVVASVQLVGILTALPVFFAPVNVVPPGGIILATAGTLATIAIVAMILSDASRLVLTALAVIVAVALYAGVVAAGTALVPATADRLVQTVAAVSVAVAFAPLVSLLRRTVGRGIYGGRIEPTATALHIARRRLDGSDALSAALDDAAASLRLPRLELVEAGIVLAVGSSRASSTTTTVIELPLEQDDTFLLRVALRRGERDLHRDDRAALALIALPLVLLARESALLAEVRATRAALADVRQREQLALHRDLHDGLGPLLTGAVMRADAARNLLADAEHPAAEQLDAARSDLRIAIADVRRVVYGLWPTELEQRGLEGAIAARALRAGVSVHIAPHLSDLPPAVELASYRIASEAIANVERHAPGSSARLEFRVDEDAAELTVTNTTPSGIAFVPGVGLNSIRERAEELGGRVHAGPAPEGWQVHVSIPLQRRFG